ncbi:MAG TPA: TIGR04255 family protein [Phycisphaerae bacterium]|nr:TIGR04255 family protein [Phycisphaerae bacterium]
MGTHISFKNPPVVETILSIQFERLRGLKSVHLGAFWQQRKGEWPQISDAPLLDEKFETFGKQPAWNRAIQLRLTQEPNARIQMRNIRGDRMIQLQNCRVDYNWIGKPGKPYPRYKKVRLEFDDVLGDFMKMIKEDKLGEVVPNQWEVTYVNYIPKETIWTNAEEWPTIFNSLPGLAVTPTGTRFEGCGGHWHFEIEPKRGRLHVELQHAYVGAEEKKETLVLKLTARGPIDKEKDSKISIDEGLNLGHDIIVQSFFDITSKPAHEYWKVRR